MGYPHNVMAGAVALLLLAAAATPLPAAADGTNYYVDGVSGSDSNSGTSESSPWRSLSRVQSRGYSPGDTINFKRGSSWSGGLTVRSSGNASAPITLKAYGSGARPAISNPGVKYGAAIRIEASYVVVQDFLLSDTNEAGVFVARGGGSNVVRDNEVTDTGVGFVLAGAGNLVTGNYVHDLHLVVNTQGGDDDYGANGVLISASNNEISYNRFERLRTASYDYGTDGGAIEIYGRVSDLNIHHNHSRGGNGFIEIGGGSAANVTVAQNVSDNDYYALIMAHLTGNFASSVSNFKVEQNTIVKSSREWTILDFHGSPQPGAFTFRNNVVHSQMNVANNAGFTHGNNVYYLYNGAKLGFALGPGEKEADPQFVDAAGGDYRLKAGSPAIDAGAGLGYSLDFDNRSMAGSGAPDAGAFEHSAAPVLAQQMSTGEARFQLGFATLANLLGAIAGSPLENEWHNADNGDGLQQTTTGLMVWRKADNWTAFTNGSWTWVNGPYGVQDRPNDVRFAWEAP